MLTVLNVDIKETKMTELNGIYPDHSNFRRQKNNCSMCLISEDCDCTCETCSDARERLIEHKKYLKSITDPRD